LDGEDKPIEKSFVLINFFFQQFFSTITFYSQEFFFEMPLKPQSLNNSVQNIFSQSFQKLPC